MPNGPAADPVMICRKPMSRAFPFGFRKIVAAMVFSCCIAGGVSAMTGTSISNSEQAVAISVNRVNKGDRLPQSSLLSHPLNDRLRPVTTSSPPEKPPLGCDPAFSPIEAPGLAHIFNRCLT